LSTSGSLSQLTIPEIFRNLLEQQLSGKLRVSCGPFKKVVYFEKGQPAGASSSDPADSLGEVLVRRGRITRDQLVKALASVQSLKEAGKALVAIGAIPPDDLLASLQLQAHEIVLSLFTLPDGSYVFEPGEASGEEVVRLRLKAETILKEGARRMTDPRMLLRALGSMEATIEAAAGGGLSLPLEQREELLLAAMRRGRQSVREICQRSKLPALHTCQALVAFVASGTARRVS